ncbi:hypothetical protein Tco_1203240 [Tanacetum coccineum]
MIITETEHGHERSDCQSFRCTYNRAVEIYKIATYYECLILLRTVTVGTTYSTPGVCYASTAVGNNGEGSRAVHNEGKHRFSRKNGNAAAIAISNPTSITDP